MQWKYIAGNNWGICKDGNGAVGCGEQEEFRACSDIAVGKGAVSTIPTIKPSKIKPTADKWPPNVNENEVEHDHDHNHDHHPTPSETNEDSQKPSSPSSPSNFFGAIIAMFTFFLVLCAFAAIYVYVYHGDILKSLLRRQHYHENTLLRNVNPSPTSLLEPLPQDEPPQRPPRTKNLAQNLQDMHNGQSNVTSTSDKHTSCA